MTLEQLWRQPNRDITKTAARKSKPGHYISMGHKTPKAAFDAAFYKSDLQYEDYAADDWEFESDTPFRLNLEG